MNRHGQASRFAYSPAALVAYLDALDRPACYTDDHHGRIIRRWRRKAQGVTLSAAVEMLGDYGYLNTQFEDWCYEAGITAILRDRSFMARTVEQPGY